MLLNPNVRERARQQLEALHLADLKKLYGEDWPYHSDFAQMVREVADGLSTAAMAVAHRLALKK